MLKNKNGILYYTQTDSRFKNEVMTHPEYQQKPDTWGQYGCLNTALLNIYNDYYNLNMNPKEFNDKLKENNGYFYLFYKNLYKNDIDKVKAICFEKESYVIWEIALEILKIEKTNRNFKGKIDLSPPEIYYIVRLKLSDGSSHFCNIIGCYTQNIDSLCYFDVYDGKIKRNTKNVAEIIQVVLPK